MQQQKSNLQDKKEETMLSAALKDSGVADMSTLLSTGALDYSNL